MTPYEFSSLSRAEQAETVQTGKYVLYREEIAHTILLYRVQNFFVEVYYNNENNQIMRFYPFDARERLKLYFRLQLN